MTEGRKKKEEKTKLKKRGGTQQSDDDEPPPTNKAGRKKHKKKTETESAIASVLPGLSIAHPSDVLDMPVDPNEPTYCLCHQVSYGEMIACDKPDVSKRDYITFLDFRVIEYLFTNFFTLLLYFSA